MKRILAAALLAAAAGLSACDSADPSETEKDVAAVAPTPAETTESATTDAAGASTAPTGGAPAFAIVYPGGELEQEPITTTGPTGAGGLISFRSDADAETIVAFYRQKAEGAGLNSVTAMNMGETRSYGAAGSGGNLQVVATPVEGRTSVQVTWSSRQ